METRAQTIGWNLDAERILWRGICAPNSWHGDDGHTPATHADSMWHFVNKAWGARYYLDAHPAVPYWLYEPIHRKFCAWLQKHILAWQKHARSQTPGRYHIAAVLPRGYGKTVCATKAASLWSHLNDPDVSTLYNSATADLSVEILKAVGNVISGQTTEAWFPWLYGNWKQGSTEWKLSASIKDGYRRSSSISEPSFDATGAGAGATGWHHGQHWWDDPIIKNKLKEDRMAYMKGVHDAVNASYNAVLSNGLMAFVLTRYLDDDVAGRHWREEGIATWEGMPCPNMTMFDKVPFGEGVWHVFFYQTEDELTGEPTHPRLWTKAMIAEAKRRDPEDFACQQQNNPGASERAPLIESQLPYLYLDYSDFMFSVPIKWATVHIDTAFKTLETVRTGDDSAIVVWLADARDNGLLYLDTDLLRASNEWREEDFNLKLVEVCLNLRRRGIFIRAITDELEPGGKAGTYKNRILGILAGAGIQIGDKNFIQINRKVSKRARIRTGAGNWAEGYVRVLLRKDPSGQFIVPPIVRKTFSQILRVDVIQHDDLADCATDGFIKELWQKPLGQPGIPQESAAPRRPWDDELKGVGKPPTNEELLALIDEAKELEQEGRSDGVRGRDFFDTGDPGEEFWASRELHTRLGL